MADLTGKNFTFTNDMENVDVTLMKVKRIPSGTKGKIVSDITYAGYGAPRFVTGEFELNGLILKTKGNMITTPGAAPSSFQGKWEVNNEENNPVEENVEEEFEVDPNNLLLHGGKKKLRRRGKTAKKSKKSKKTRKVNRKYS
jgi:hypothetical protein